MERFTTATAWFASSVRSFGTQYVNPCTQIIICVTASYILSKGCAWSTPLTVTDSLKALCITPGCLLVSTLLAIYDRLSAPSAAIGDKAGACRRLADSC